MSRSLRGEGQINTVYLKGQVWTQYIKFSDGNECGNDNRNTAVSQILLINELEDADNMCNLLLKIQVKLEIKHLQFLRSSLDKFCDKRTDRWM